jgi:hypothetical protein
MQSMPESMELDDVIPTAHDTHRVSVDRAMQDEVDWRLHASLCVCSGAALLVCKVHMRSL